MDLTRSYRALPGLTGFYRMLLSTQGAIIQVLLEVEWSQYTIFLTIGSFFKIYILVCSKRKFIKIQFGKYIKRIW